MRWLVFLLVLFNFVITLVAVSSILSVVSSLGASSSWLSALSLWMILMAFCNVCIAFWVAKDEESIREIYGIFKRTITKSKSQKSYQLTEPKFSLTDIDDFYESGLGCGTCAYFKKPECPRREKLENAKPCEEYTVLLEQRK